MAESSYRTLGLAYKDMAMADFLNAVGELVIEPQSPDRRSEQSPSRQK